MAFRSIPLASKLVVGGAAGAVVGGWLYFDFGPQLRDTYLNTSNKAMINSFEMGRNESAYKKLQATESNSLLKKHLTPAVFEKLKHRKTKVGGTLFHLINSGVENPEASIGVYVPEAEGYSAFAELLDPIIAEYHQTPSSTRQPPVDLGDGKTDTLPDLDPEGKFVLSTRIRCGRTLKDFPMNSLMQRDDYLAMETRLSRALKRLPDDELRGSYFPLDGMKADVQKNLIADHFLFKDNDRHLGSAQATRHWPVGRGIFHNVSKTFLVWVGEEDHVRIIAMEKGAKVGQVLDRLNRGIRGLEAEVPFARDDRLGWITFCPTNLGSTVRASVHIRLPKVSARPDFEALADSLKLQVRGIHGEHSKSEGGVYDVSNKRRLGLSEFAAVKEMHDGVARLIELEKMGGYDKNEKAKL